MSRLTVYPDTNASSVQFQSSVHADIAAQLSTIGVIFEQWTATSDITAESSSEDILASYSASIDRLKAAGGYQSADVINMKPDHPDRVALRAKFLAEHQHSEDEVRFFVRGTGMFYLHVDGKIYAVQCCRGDLISVPANACHWFDMGDAPEFTCIRLFTNPDGWVAKYTGDVIADRYPRFEDLVEDAVA